MANFVPFDQSSATVSLAVTSVTGSATISTTAQSESVILTNAGSVLCFVVFGIGSATATSAGIPILPGSAICVSRNILEDTVAAITLASTTTLYITPGWGN